mmetsp:Transcript_23626/g.46064  ORF Transcript_23626/g.46064 Transcript_23626/m.46064 type:complete len:171 (+) Transcript_23626:1000-1512(+)
MSGCHVTAKVAIAALRNLKELRRLELPFCSEFGDEGAKGLPSVCPYLELVDLYSCRTLTNEGLLSMASSLPYLKCLNAKRCHKLASFQVCDVLEHKALLHLQLPNFAGLNSCAVMLKLENAGFTHEGSGRLFRCGCPIRTSDTTDESIAPHPTSGLYLRCPVCIISRPGL